MGLTGYLLPFDNRSYWATIVAMNITASGPIVGPYLADFLRAGSSSPPQPCRGSTPSTCCSSRG